jgi:hypothetical protein
MLLQSRGWVFLMLVVLVHSALPEVTQCRPSHPKTHQLAYQKLQQHVLIVFAPAIPAGCSTQGGLCAPPVASPPPPCFPWLQRQADQGVGRGLGGGVGEEVQEGRQQQLAQGELQGQGNRSRSS